MTCTRLIVMIALIMSAPLAGAQTWEKRSELSANQAVYEARSGGAVLSIGCRAGDRVLTVQLEATVPLSGGTREVLGLALLIETPSGEIARLPLQSRVASLDGTAVRATIDPRPAELDQLAQGQRLRLVDTNGFVVFTADMSGTAAAVRDYRSVCLI